jgi:hypothetical protein
MVCCAMGKDPSVGSAPWRAYVLVLTLTSGAAATAGLLAVSALAPVSDHCRSWRPSIAAFLRGTIRPRLARFIDRELFTSLSRWRCRLSGALIHRAPRLGGFAYRYFNLALLLAAVALCAALLAVLWRLA